MSKVTTEQLCEFFAQIESGRIVGESLQDFLEKASEIAFQKLLENAIKLARNETRRVLARYKRDMESESYCDSRFFNLRLLAEAGGQLPDFEAAIKAAETTDHTKGGYELDMNTLVAALRREGYLDLAERVAEQGGKFRPYALGGIAHDFACRKEIRKAREICSLANHPFYHALVYAEIWKTTGYVEDWQRAVTAAISIEEPADRCSARLFVAETTKSEDDIVAARKVLEDTEAKELWPHSGYGAWLRLAKISKQPSDLDRGVAIFKSLSENPSTPHTGDADIALGAVKGCLAAGGLSHATDIAEGMGSGYWKCFALTEIALAEKAADDMVGCAVHLDAAHKLAVQESPQCGFQARCIMAISRVREVYDSARASVRAYDESSFDTGDAYRLWAQLATLTRDPRDLSKALSGATSERVMENKLHNLIELVEILKGNKRFEVY